MARKNAPLPYNKRNISAAAIAAEHADSIKDKVVLTTGVSPGSQGAHFVETIAKHQPRLLILAGRNASKIQQTAEKIRNDPECEGVTVRVLSLDLASQVAVWKAARQVNAYPEAIDVVMNSAAVMAGPYRTTEHGIELQFGANHVGHYLFTNLIMKKILAAPNPRIVNVSSDGHRLGPVRFSDWNFSGGASYDQWEAYGQSKSANILFTKGLAQKLGPKGLRSFSLHPGVIYGSSLAPAITNAMMGVTPVAAGADEKGNAKAIDEGTASHVIAAFDPRLDDYNGAYLENGNISDHARPTVSDPDDVDKLWKLSERLVATEFDY
jgi:NAD(P)-dependent dehydrogenase (short-subunit alcohol dehydrogenase family)